MKNYKFVCYLLLLAAIVVFGCGAPASLMALAEKGEISFVSPASGAKFHDPEGQAQPLAVIIHSTFKDPKLATITSPSGTYQCQIGGEGSNTPCGSIPLVLGENTLTAQVYKVDGVTIVSTQTTFYWAPYSPLDRSMGWIASKVGGPLADASLGYALVGGIAMLIASYFFLGQGRWGAAAIIFLAIIGLAIYSQQTGSVVVTLAIVNGFIKLVGGVFTLLIILNIVNKTHFFHVRREDGAGLTYIGSGGEKGAKVVQAIGQNGEQLLGRPASNYHQGQQHLPPMQSRYLEPGDSEDLVTYSEIPASGLGGFINRLRGK